MITQQLLDYIEKEVRNGTDKDKIKEILLENGWDKEDIREAFDIVYGSMTSINKYVSPKDYPKAKTMPKNKDVLQKQEEIITKLNNEGRGIKRRSRKGAFTVVLIIITVLLGLAAYYFYSTII